MTDAVARLTAALADRYHIERELGAGGMATVYLAHDVRHDRKVALKVLRPELSAILGAERFLAEIKTTANLQHPHILPLHDSGEANGTVFYVMPYVEGESLRDRITRERQLPIEQAVRIAREVADALEYAHQQGVIHRDIKPENILLRGGHAQVADFGIALAVSRSEGSTRMTETGMSLGTPHYMAPEQAMGEKEITPKADVYALGCVLYEMLTGEPPFTGPTAQAIVARVMTEQPRALTLQRHTVPPHVEAAVNTALEKLPADRFASAAEFAAALDDRTFSAAAPAPALARTAPALPWSRRPAALIPWAVTVLALAFAAWAWVRAGGAARTRAHWEYIGLSESLQVNPGFPALALSPDGTTLVVRDNVLNGRLWVKHQGELESTPLVGTERASYPTFSPDGAWIAFIADGQLKKVRAGGGPTVTIADSLAQGNFSGLAWLDDGTLIFVRPNLVSFARVSAAGGAMTELPVDSALAGIGTGHPTPLPGARGVLFQACSSGCATMSIHVLDLRTGRQKPLLSDVAQAWYLPTGQLLYVRRDGVGLVAPFDLSKLELSGAAVPVLDGVQVGFGFASLALSRAGDLVYVRGSGAATLTTMVRVSREGRAVPIDSAWSGQLLSFALSPDGRRMAVGQGSSVGGLNIWIKQLDRGPATRLSFGGGDRRPVWSPDGRLVAFVRDTMGTSVVVARPADGSGPDRRLARLDRQVQEIAWSHDGKWLVLRTDNGQRGAGDLVGMRVGGDTTPVPLAVSEFTELHPALSPDGRWLAYTSNESGTNEVYVRPFPATGNGRWQVSNGGGSQPVFAPNGRELFFIDAANRMVAAPIGAGPAFTPGTLRPLFDASGFVLDAFHTGYAVEADGRFIMAVPKQAGVALHQVRLVYVANWLADLRARLRQ